MSRLSNTGEPQGGKTRKIVAGLFMSLAVVSMMSVVPALLLPCAPQRQQHEQDQAPLGNDGLRRHAA